ncbi:N-lysine methyltransferase setd6 [Coffea eugenioides]|uniref:N-lysine methyltransferase setd6 n=1 Tax=Coffea eugenioides TaxID=49369 RepID=UPI000F60B9CB|nr:N-lysine methyltransferase setd6 [Coffea eugenioides]
MATRKMRAFKRWMKSQGIDCSDALDLVLTNYASSPSPSPSSSFSVSVRALCDLQEGDIVARIPKGSCLTIKTSRARPVIEAAGLDGFLGLAVAVMYERSLGPLSNWFVYLQLMPFSEPIPLLWSDHEIDSLLVGTELHKMVKEDKDLIYEDWKECIQPLLVSAPLELNPQFFGIEQYFAARSLIASRSFQIDDYYGSGMVPLADLFNHKTGAEDVHFTSLVSEVESDQDADINPRNDECESHMNDTLLSENSYERNGSSGGSEFDCSSTSGDDLTVLEMIMVKGVKTGNEVFNTYGSLGNAALLHRYGFTEADNPFDILNIDLELVDQWSSSLFSRRYHRRRLLLWRRLDYCGCVSQNVEYFEVSFEGEPQVELLVLLYIMLLPEESHNELDLLVSSMGNICRPANQSCSEKFFVAFGKKSELNKDLLLTESVRAALLSLADIRESLYGSSSLDADIEALNNCDSLKEPNFYYSLLLRISERRILDKFRSYATCGADFPRTSKKAMTRSKMSRT